MSAAIVVRTPNWLGDTVMALPMLAALRAAEPAARITLVGRWATLLAGQGVADVALPYPTPLAPRRGWRARSRPSAPDVAVLLPSSIEAALAAWRWRAAPPRRLRHRRARGRSSPTRCRCPRRACTRWTSTRRLARRRSACAASPRRPRGPCAATTRMDAEVARLLAEARRRGRRAPRSASTWARPSGARKLWPAEAFGAPRERLAAAGLTPGPAGHPRTTRTPPPRSSSPRGGPIASLVGRDRPALLPRLLARLRCLVSGDTGVAHLAAAVGVATVTLFGPTDPPAHRPARTRQPDPRPRRRRARPAFFLAVPSTMSASPGSIRTRCCTRSGRPWREDGAAHGSLARAGRPGGAHAQRGPLDGRARLARAGRRPARRAPAGARARRRARDRADPHGRPGGSAARWSAWCG